MHTQLPSVRQSTVLLVEDDELVSDAVTRNLVRRGYMMMTAATAHDAIGLLRTPGASIDVVVLDIGLPDVSGLDLCARVREIYPRLPVVVCTGAALPEQIEALRKLGITRFFSKPIAIDELDQALQHALGDTL
jgi:DNA-binding NtrC family response regulator